MTVCEVVLMEVWEAVLGLVHATKDEHRVCADHRCVAVARPRCGPTGLYLHPHVRRDVVLKQLLDDVVPIPTAEDVHGMAVDHRSVTEDAPRHRIAHRVDFAPALFTEVELSEVIEPVVAIEAPEDEQGVAKEHHAVVGSLLRRLPQGVNCAPLAGPDVILVHVVEILAVLLGVAAEEPHRMVPHSGLGTTPGRRHLPSCSDLLPEIRLHVVRVDIALASYTVRAAEEVEHTVLVHNRVPCSRSVHIAHIVEVLPAAKLRTVRGQAHLGFDPCAKCYSMPG
mmetsp:Transcript_110192/g.235256  ORF Transcript_110192/g.235256 Transcript_110192/m.235256 type:complete len:281 (-) Transcript_110192:24-866(-)